MSIIALLVSAFARSAASGVGYAYRVTQYLYYSFRSLNSYQKGNHEGQSLLELLDAQPPSVIDSVIGRIFPGQKGWFATRFPTDKGTLHNYVGYYDALFSPYRTQGDLRLLEVGVKKGGSLVLWREYFPHSALIFGIDVHRGAPQFPRDAHLKTLALDSRDRDEVANALRGLRFDIIIDDGLHHPTAQQDTYASLRPFLKPSGVYVIEDVYSFRKDDYAGLGDDVLIIPDKSGQSLVILRPADSLAPRLTVGHNPSEAAL